MPLNTSLPQADVDWLVGKSRPGRARAAGRRRLPAADGGPVRLVVTADADGLVDGVRAAAGGAAAPRRPAVGRARGRARGRAGDDHVHLGHHGPAQGRLPDAARRLEQRRARGADARPAAPTTASSSTRRRTSPAASATSSRCSRPAAAWPASSASSSAPACSTRWRRWAAPASAARRRTWCASWSRWRSRARTRFRFWVSSGDHLPLPVIEKFRRVLPGVGLFNMYGLTEVSGRLCILPPAELDVRVGSVGRPIGDMRVVARRGDGDGGRARRDRRALRHGLAAHAGLPGRARDHRRGRSPRTASGPATSATSTRAAPCGSPAARTTSSSAAARRSASSTCSRRCRGSGRFADVAVLAAPDEILGHVPVAFVVPLEPDGFKASRAAARAARRAAVHVPAQPRHRRRGDPAHRLRQGDPGRAAALLAEELG